MLTPHTFQPHSFAPARTYVLWEWTCSCGASGATRTRSKAQAMLDWFSTHVMPDIAPGEHPYPHTATIVDGKFDHGTGKAKTWLCACGLLGHPGGYSEPRRALAAHSQHANEATLRDYMEIHLRAIHGQTPDEYAAYKEAELRQRWQHEDEATRSKRWRAEAMRLAPEAIEDDAMYAALNNLI